MEASVVFTQIMVCCLGEIGPLCIDPKLELVTSGHGEIAAAASIFALSTTDRVGEPPQSRICA
jgi:hypothetical protein